MSGATFVGFHVSNSAIITVDKQTPTAEAFNFDQDEMMHAIIHNNNKELNDVRRAFEALNWVT